MSIHNGFFVFPSQASLVASDRLYQSKKEILDSVGLDNPQEFPITKEGMPVQLLSYLRLARLQNSAEFARVGSLKPLSRR